MHNNLIIQGKNIETPRLKELARLAGADSIQAVTPNAFCLTHARTENRNQIVAACEQAKLDYG
ncbi:MAG: DUF4072 domain-containing protein, partial [Burkholderiales bacterium]